jgi:hypothetical protein
MYAIAKIRKNIDMDETFFITFRRRDERSASADQMAKPEFWPEGRKTGVTV